ncbi:MAG: Spi family protease inhibitor [Muribaculaceae bacterium]|nr:Spi family protease inhibitor [Muribaculaceae bacterium]
MIIRILTHIIICLFTVACTAQMEEPQVKMAEESNQATFITPDEACSIAVDSYNRFHGLSTDTPSRSIRSAKAHLYHASLSRSNQEALYVVEFDEGGFAVVNAFRNTQTDLLALVDEGTFDDTANSGLKYYMEYATERVISENANQANTYGAGSNIGIVPIQQDKFIRADSTLHLTYIKWSRNSPYNNDLPLINGTSEHYPLGSLATAIGSLAANYYYEMGRNDVESFREGGKKYSFDWDEILAAPSYGRLREEGKKGVCSFLSYAYMKVAEYPEYMEDGQFINHDIVPDALEDVINGTPWFRGAAIEFSHVSAESLSSEISMKGPQMMYGETDEETVGDVWLIEGVKTELWRKESPWIEGSDHSVNDGIVEYTKDYIYINWCLEGHSNGWFYYYSGLADYSNNDPQKPDYDPNIYGQSYTHHIIPVLNIRKK